MLIDAAEAPGRTLLACQPSLAMLPPAVVRSKRVVASTFGRANRTRSVRRASGLILVGLSEMWSALPLFRGGRLLARLCSLAPSALGRIPPRAAGGAQVGFCLTTDWRRQLRVIADAKGVDLLPVQPFLAEFNRFGQACLGRAAWVRRQGPLEVVHSPLFELSRVLGDLLGEVAAETGADLSHGAGEILLGSSWLARTYDLRLFIEAAKPCGAGGPACHAAHNQYSLSVYASTPRLCGIFDPPHHHIKEAGSRVSGGLMTAAAEAVGGCDERTCGVCCDKFLR